jgi:gliding motility-associated-like protein
MAKLLPYLFCFFGLLSLPPPAGAQCGYTATARTNNNYCVGSSLLVQSSHTLKKIVWYKDGQPVDSAFANESLDRSVPITLDGTGVSDDLVSDDAGNIYTIDLSHQRIVKWTPGAGTGVTTVGSYTWGESDINTLFVDHQGNVYVANDDHKTVLKYTPGDTVGVPVVQDPGNQGGFGYGLYVDCQGMIYIENGASISKWLPGAASGTLVVKADASSSDDFGGPFLVDSMGNIVIASFGILTKWAPGDTSGTLISSWSVPGVWVHMFIGGDDSVLMLAVLPIEEAGPGVSTPIVLGSVAEAAGIEEGDAGVIMDPKGNIFAMKDYGPVIYELKRHSSIDTTFTPQDTGAYYAIATNMQGFSIKTNTIVINSPLSGTPSISITATAASAPVCTPITFTASSTNFGLDPAFQWQVSGVPAGGDSTTYSYNLFANGDQVDCILTAQAGCTGPVQDTSNIITLNIDARGAASVTISTPKDSICQGDTAIFTATVTNGSSQPTFAWLVNGDSTTDNTDVFNGSNLSNGSVVTCLITSDDACGLAKSNSIPLTVSVPPAVESGQIFTILHGHSLTLDPITTGDIDSWLWTPATGLSNTSIADPVANPDTNTLYTLFVTAPGGCSATGTILVNVYTPLSIPNAFTPNGDGHNDDFYVLGGPVNSVVENFAVFNRFGAEVFHVHDVAPGDKSRAWDGTFHGAPAPAGTYVYLIEIKFASGARQIYKGTVILIR